MRKGRSLDKSAPGDTYRRHEKGISQGGMTRGFLGIAEEGIWLIVRVVCVSVAAPVDRDESCCGPRRRRRRGTTKLKLKG